MKQKYKYTAGDFERYHSGKMSERDMHALEKAALEDHFLADALEGYAYSSTPVTDINELSKKLLPKKKKRNIFFFLQKENVWLRIAAVFILIAGIGYLVYTLNTKKETSLLSKNNSVENKKTATEQTAASQNDSATINKEDNLIAKSDKSRKTLSPNLNKIPAQEFKVSSDRAVNDLSQNAPVRSLAKSIPAEFLKDRNGLSENIVKGKVVDSLGYPVRYASIMDKNRRTITTSDSSGRFKLPVADSLLTAQVSAVGYKTKEVMLRDKNNQVVVLEPANQSMNEVVVTAMGVKKEKRQSGYATPKLESKVAGVSVNGIGSEPVGGWQKFNQYIRDNITVPENNAGENYKGKVILSFEINKKGKPKNIKVEQPLCTSCDEEATRLLQRGPKWKYVDNKRQTVTIQFGN